MAYTVPVLIHTMATGGIYPKNVDAKIFCEQLLTITIELL